MYVHTYIPIRIHSYVHMHLCCIQGPTYIYSLIIHVYMYIPILLQTFVCVYVCPTYVYAHMYLCMHVSMYVCMYAYVHFSLCRFFINTYYIQMYE